MPENKSSSTAASATKDSAHHSHKYTSIRGWIELTENAGIDDNLRDFVKGLNAEAKKLGDSRLKTVRLFYWCPDYDPEFIQQFPYRIKVVLELPNNKYEKIAEGTSTSSFIKAFLRCENGVLSFFHSDAAAKTVVKDLLSSLRSRSSLENPTMPENRSSSTAASATKESTHHSRKHTSIRGWIELTEDSRIDDNLRDFVKGLNADAKKLNDSDLKSARLFYRTPDYDPEFIQQFPYRIKVVLELPNNKYEKIAEGTSTSSFIKAFLRCENGVLSFFRPDAAATTVIGDLLSSLHKKVEEKQAI
ncbi:hypothetical protein ACEPAG_1865 [Sanghuangporus baumii]